MRLARGAGRLWRLGGNNGKLRKIDEGLLVLGELPRQVEQGLAAIKLREMPRVNEFVAEPGELPRLEAIHQPIHHVTDARDAGHVRMASEPNIQRAADLELQRHEPPRDRGRIARQPTDTRPAADRQRMGTAGIGPYRRRVRLRGAEYRRLNLLERAFLASLDD